MLKKLGLEVVLSLPFAPQFYDRETAHVLDENSPSEFAGIPSFSEITVRKINDKESVASYQQETNLLHDGEIEADFTFHWTTGLVGLNSVLFPDEDDSSFSKDYFVKVRICVKFQQFCGPRECGPYRFLVSYSAYVNDYGNVRKYLIEAKRKKIAEMTQQLKRLETYIDEEMPTLSKKIKTSSE